MAVHLDADGGQPLHPVARAALLAALDDGWADPARRHADGRRARALLDEARASVATDLGCRPDEVSFTPNATLATHLGVLGAAGARHRAGTTVLCSAVESPAVLQAAQRLEPVLLPVDGVGRVQPFDVPSDTALVCLQAANPEVGTLQPVETVAERCREAGVPLLVDADAALGRVVVPTGWSVLVAGARSFGGPAGVGLLAIRTGTRWRSPLPDDERPDRSPGSPDVPLVVAAAAALRAAVAEQSAEDPRLRALTTALREALTAAGSGVTALGDPDDRLPHLAAFTVDGVRSEELVWALDAEGVRVSSGSACSASSVEPSHVLLAMGVPAEGAFQVTLGRDSSYDDVHALAAALPRVVERLRSG